MQWLQWLIDNKEWIFSGIGVAGLGVFLAKKNFRRQIQKSGDHSKNTQVGEGGIYLEEVRIGEQEYVQKAGNNSSNILNIGLSYKDALEIAHNVYDNNFYRLAHEAGEIAYKRAEELSEKFLLNLQETKPEAISEMKSPGMQATLYEAQKEYAKSGDHALKDLLVDILVERAMTPDRCQEQITLEESIKVVSKLTSQHLDCLSTSLLITRRKIHEFESPSEFIQRQLSPFLNNFSGDSSIFEHLEYAGCGSIMRVARWPDIEDILLAQYPASFEGMGSMQVRHFLEGNHPQISNLLNGWGNSTISKFSLTTVGVEIARANYQKRIGEKLIIAAPVISPYVD